MVPAVPDGQLIGTSPITAGSVVFDRATERLDASHRSKSPCNVCSIQSFEKILPLLQAAACVHV